MLVVTPKGHEARCSLGPRRQRSGEKIQLVGFGTFEVSERAARTGRNPQSGKEMKIPASKAPKFKAGKALKDMINA